MEHYSIDYANWDDTVDFIKNRNEHYISSNFSDSQLPDMELNGIIYFDNEMNVVFAKTQDIKTGKYLSNPFNKPENRQIIESIFISPESVDMNKKSLSRSGLLFIGNKPVIFSLTAVTDSDSNAPSYGNVLFWRYFDLEVINSIIETTQLNIYFFWIKNGEDFNNRNSVTIQKAFQGLNDHKRNQDNRVSFIIKDYFKNPILNIVIQQTAHNYDDRLFSKNLIAGILTSFLCIIFLFYFINKNFLVTLRIFLNHFSKVEETQDYSLKLFLDRNDELSHLSNAVNLMMEKIKDRNKQLENSNRELENLSNTDALTKISNRRHMDIVFNKKMEEAILEKKHLSFCLCDVDFFKLYNDTYGHQNGDYVLKEVAKTLNENLHSSTDHAARYGGEEFAVILYNTDINGSCRVAENLIKSVENLMIKHKFSECSEFVTISIGISTIKPDYESDPDEIIKSADNALYMAKKSGRNRYIHSSLYSTD